MSVPRLGLQQHDGRGLRFQQFHFRRRDLAICPRHFERRHHQRKRLLLAMLALPQARHCLGIARIHQKLESSNAFERDDLALSQRLDRIFDGAVELRPAHRARVGLRVKAAVRRILVFLAAPRAQHEITHRRVGPVIRNVDDDGVARPAIRAVGEGIFKAAIVGIEQFFAAVGAGGQVRQHVDRLAGVVVAG